MAINQDLRALILSGLASIDFYYIFFKTASYEGTGLTVKGIRVEELLNFPFPLPPLAEQHRIVAKVDELMRLCDELEATQAKRERRRDRLVAATLYGLNNGDANNLSFPLVRARADSPRRIGNPSEERLRASRSDNGFEDSARFYFNHLPCLITRPEHIHQLRKTILNLAVRGKLVAQDPRDEPARKLLKRLYVKKSKELHQLQEIEVPVKLPESWAWTKTESLCEIIVDCPHSTPKFIPEGIVCIDTNAFKGGLLIPHKIRYVSEATYLERVQRSTPRHGDIVFAREGSVGESVIVPEGMKCCLGQRVMLFRPFQDILSVYFQLALSEPSSLARLLALHKGIGAKHVNVADMRNALIPLPPLAEQHRIVAKVDELMALCDQIETRITTDTMTNRKFLEATLQEAL